MTPEDLSARVRAIVAKTLEVPEAAVEPDTHFAHDLGGDDLDRIELMFEIEAAWDIEIPDDDAEQLRTVADVVRYLARRLSAVEAATLVGAP